MVVMKIRNRRITLYYKCLECLEFKPIIRRSKLYCSSSCKDKAQYRRTGVDRYRVRSSTAQPEQPTQ